MIDHGALTDELLGLLRASDLLVGDGAAPSEGGWVLGQPNVSAFVPYMVLVDGGSRRTNEGYCDMPDWASSWSMRFFGGSRKQCDWIATAGRRALQAIESFTFGEPTYRALHIEVNTLGAVTRLDQVDPPYWQAFDSVSILCTPLRASVPRFGVPSKGIA